MKTLRYSNLEKIMTIYTEISTYITFHNGNQINIQAEATEFS